jgi:disulfide bond formation protein DsbB
MRLPWLIMGVTALILNLIAHYVFQIAMGLAPCEYCVYVRFSMFCIFFGCVIVAILPRNQLWRVIFGWGLAGYGIIQGAIWNFKLANILNVFEQLERGVDFFSLNAGTMQCSMFPGFPLGIPLDIWFPSWFSPTGGCGPIDWTFLGMNMPQSLFIFYGIYLIALVLIVISDISSSIKHR